MHKLLTVASLLALSVVSCKNDVAEVEKPISIGNDIVVDFRDAIIGNYEGTERDYSYLMASPPNISDTTFAKTLVVTKALDSASVTISAADYVLDSSLTYYVMSVPGPTIAEVKFRNDSCLMYFRNGGLGGYQERTIKTKRQ
jgi:hypothetical protein